MASFDAVVLGSGLDFGHWVQAAHELVYRCVMRPWEDMRLWERPVCLFFSGPDRPSGPAGPWAEGPVRFDGVLRLTDARAPGHRRAPSKRTGSAGSWRNTRTVPAGATSGSPRPVQGWQSLTRRVLRVARQIALRHTNRSAATKLALSPDTIATHLRSAFRKMDVSSRVQLAIRDSRGVAEQLACWAPRKPVVIRSSCELPFGWLCLSWSRRFVTF